MGSAVAQLPRRTVIALVLAFGLALMHGGIGQAMVCDGPMAMPAMAMAATTSTSMPNVDVQATAHHALHHQPADQPSAVHTAMCVSTPAVAGAGGSKAGPSVVALHDQRLQQFVYRALLLRVPSTGREPPPPDLVSELCVIRI